MTQRTNGLDAQAIDSSALNCFIALTHRDACCIAVVNNCMLSLAAQRAFAGAMPGLKKDLKLQFFLVLA